MIWFFTWYKFKKAKNYSKNYGWVWSKNGHSILGHGNPKFVLSQEWFDKFSWFSCMLYKFSKAESYWVGAVKYGHGHRYGHRTLKSAVSQDWCDELSWVFACWYKFRKAKSRAISLISIKVFNAFFWAVGILFCSKATAVNLHK